MEFELRRKAFHVGLGTLGLILIHYDMFYLVPATALLLSGVAVSLVSRSKELPVIEFLLDLAERDHHRSTFPGKGPASALLAAIVVVAAFDKDVALASVAALTFGDSLSHLVGVRYGKVPNPLNREKDVEGFVAGFLATFAASLFLLEPLTAGFASFTGMVVESLDAKIGRWSVSDNLTVPLTVAVSAYLLQNYVLPAL